MIGGVQKKVLVTIKDNKFVLDKIFKELIEPNKNTQWKLVRESDNLTKYSEKIKWLEFNEDGTFKAEHKNMSVGYCLLMSPFSREFNWQTTEVIKIIKKGDFQTKFKTKNSVYTLTYKL